MKKELVFLFVIIAGFDLACHRQPVTTTDPTTISHVPKLIIDINAKAKGTGASYGINSMTILGNILTLEVEYSGGCAEHTFELYFDNTFFETTPIQAALILKHNNKGDTCRELITKELHFDISALKRTGTSPLVLIVGNKQITWAY
jgi:hypothetical protein